MPCSVPIMLNTFLGEIVIRDKAPMYMETLICTADLEVNFLMNVHRSFWKKGK